MSTPTEPLSGGLESIIVLGIIPGLKVLLIGAVFSSFLLPATVVLFVFSTPTLRRSPHFILNLCAIALGLTQGIIIVYVVVKEFELAPPSPKVISVITALSIVGPICVQTILFLRVLAVYPPWHQSVPARFGIYGPAIAMKVARLVNAGYLLYTIQRGNNAKTIVTQSAAIWSSPFAKSELSLQLADDVYISTLFLLKIYAGVRRSGKQLRRYSNQPRTTLSQGSYATRLRTLFWIALSNFVFPVIFDIAQLILILCNYSYTEGSYVVIVNNYISILGVLFSTIWASGTNRVGEGPSGSAADYSYSIRPHNNSYGTSIPAGHLPLPPKPVRPRPNRSLVLVPPELKARLSSRSDLETVSGEADSCEDRFIAQPRIEFSSPGHPYATAVSA